MKNDILKLIPTGKENAINCRELARLSGIDARIIKSKISKCRRQGGIICSYLDDQHGGYFFPANTAELIEYVRTEKARIETAAQALQPAINEIVRRTGV